MAKMLAHSLFFFILVSPALGQSTTISIFDSDGNQATATINNGNVFLYDSNGNTAFGTIRGGNVFLSTSNGEITFGTIKNGNVFLTDQNGNTTGTVRNGNIFLSNSDGSTTTGNYNNTQIFTTTTSTGSSSGAIQQRQEDVRAQQSADFRSGYVVGQQIGSAIAVGIQNHRIRSFCKKNGDTGYWRFVDGSIMTCLSLNSGHPVREWPAQRRQSDLGLQEDGRRAYDLMESLRRGIVDLAPYSDSPEVRSSLQESRSSWADMRNMYCKANPGAVYTDLQGQQQTCP